VPVISTQGEIVRPSGGGSPTNPSTQASVPRKKRHTRLRKQIREKLLGLEAEAV